MYASFTQIYFFKGSIHVWIKIVNTILLFEAAVLRIRFLAKFGGKGLEDAWKQMHETKKVFKLVIQSFKSPFVRGTELWIPIMTKDRIFATGV